MQKKTRRFLVTVTPDFWEELRTFAFHKRKPIAVIVREAIERQLKDEKKLEQAA